jgi:hypothetical protein
MKGASAVAEHMELLCLRLTTAASLDRIARRSPQTSADAARVQLLAQALRQMPAAPVLHFRSRC